MKTTKFLTKLLVILCFIGCKAIDYWDFKPIYYIANDSNEAVTLIYTLQPNVAEQWYTQIDTIEIEANSTAVLEFTGQNEYEDKYKPSGVFCAMKFVSESGTILREFYSISNTDWSVNTVKDSPDAAGWLYRFCTE